MRIPYSLFNTTSDTDPGAATTAGVAASSTNTYYSKPWTSYSEGWGLHVITSGTLTGTWTLWVSDLPHPDPADDDDWVDMSTHAGFVETNPAGAATKWHADPQHLFARWARLKYVNASGTGSIYAYLTPAS